MDLQSVSNAFRPEKRPVRFLFSIERDIELLKATVSANPWLHRKEKWTSVCNNLMDLYNYDLKPRTAKDRVDLLIRKLKKDELESKAGTEEQKAERVGLLQEIINLQEQENDPLIMEIGLDSKYDEFHDQVNSNSGNNYIGGAVNFKKRQLERVQQVDTERSESLSRSSSPETTETDPIPRGISAIKRTRTVADEDIIKERYRHDMKMELLKFKQKEEWQERQLALESRRLELEIEKEKRTAEENKRRDELMLAMCGLIKCLQSSLDKTKSDKTDK